MSKLAVPVDTNARTHTQCVAHSAPMAVGQTVVIEELAHLRPRTYIVAFEDHAGLGDFIDARHQHCGVVVAYVRVALIVRDLCGAARRSFRRVTGSSSSAVWPGHSVRAVATHDEQNVRRAVSGASTGADERGCKTRCGEEAGHGSGRATASADVVSGTTARRRRRRGRSIHSLQLLTSNVIPWSHSDLIRWWRWRWWQSPIQRQRQTRGRYRAAATHHRDNLGCAVRSHTGSTRPLVASQPSRIRRRALTVKGVNTKRRPESAPFGVVTLAPSGTEGGSDMGTMRWAQTGSCE